MKKSILKTILFVFISGIAFAQQKISESVLFKSNKFELTDSAAMLLDQSFGGIEDFKVQQIILTGHSDAEGTELANKILSEKRSKAVKTYFLERGISESKIKIQALGENKPVALSNDDEGKKKNRSVEIVVAGKELKITPLFSKFNKEIQKFKIRATEEVKIVGKEGTGIKIAANCLVKKNGEAVKG
ncbi:MAG: OmpA family protein, partial [Bacteroidia bacterium]|nr:OmpA family protein [Bacteroidia bacterium]